MKICKTCGIEKDLIEFYNCPTCKDGYHGSCKDCVKAKSNKKTINKKSKEPVKYRKCKNLIKPSIPIKLTSQDGFGGYYRFDYNRTLEPLINSFIRENSTLHRNKRYPILQVKSKNKQQMLDFAQCIDMDVNGVIHIEREPGCKLPKVYVVNLIGKDIRKVLNAL